MPSILRAVAAAVMAFVLDPFSAMAQDPPAEEPGNTFSLRTAIKASALMFKTPDSPDLFPQRTGAESMWRFRLEPEMRPNANLTLTVAYEQRLRYASASAGLATVGILPSQIVVPYRVRALDWRLTQSSGTSWRHEIDRASARVHARRADITIGRQAIGWGRSVMFSAVDLFAPFLPLEVDREWRRGVDAIRADIKLTNRSSVDVVSAFGRTWDRSALAGRVRGFAGPIDIDVMGGRRAEDWFGGLTSSAAVGDAEVHGELASFRVRSAGADNDAQLIWKAVLGGSYRLPFGSGVLAYVEYHYSGFGARSPETILILLSTPAFVERYVRGDTQILSQHALAVTGSYEASTEMTYSGQWLHNPRDRSGIAAPGVTYTLSDQLSLFASAYLPYGRAPRAQVLRSEFGSASLSVLLQVRIYL